MKISRIALTMLSVFALSISYAQTADEIVNKHITAIGGADVISRIKSQVMESDMSVMGSSLTSKTTIVPGKGFRNEADFNGQKIIMVITPTSGWTINPLAGMTEPSAIPEDQLKSSQSALEIGGALYDYKTKGSKVELAGKEKVENADAYKLKLVNKDGKEFTYFVDAATYYILKVVTNETINGQNVTGTTTYSDYKKTDSGFVMPYTSIANQGFEITNKVSKVEFNKEIDAKIFEMPK